MSEMIYFLDLMKEQKKGIKMFKEYKCLHIMKLL